METEKDPMMLGAFVQEDGGGDPQAMLVVGLTPLHVMRMVLGEPLMFVLPDEGPAVRRLMVMAASDPEHVEAVLKARFSKATIQ
jgi:hypothetical protein